MAVLRMYASGASYGAGSDTISDDDPKGVVATVQHLLTSELPADVQECEVTVLALFRASQVLNFLTGGKPEMTFSARAWRSRRTSRLYVSRLGWAATTAMVDAACGVLRGEQHHCATAWQNYVRRPAR